jgi:2-hydroxychromene-2-carboxylate isomerase
MTNPDRVYIDFKSPYAYIAIKAIYAIEDDLNLQFDWLPFTLDIASFAGSAKVDDKGEVVTSNRSEKQWTRVKYAYQDVRRYAKFLGLDFKAPHKIWDSSLAAIGLLWAKRQDQDSMRGYIDGTFTRFWQRDLDIEDVNVIVAMLEQAGIDTEGFIDYLQNDGRTEHDRIQQEAANMKIFGVPSFVIKGEWYWGREHIPYIRYLLGDTNLEILSKRLAGVSTLA